MKKNIANWHNDGDKFSLTVPFSKIDREKRTVSGFASLDNIDRQGDLVSAEASTKAFERFRGNIREMHQPIAVGKIVSFKQQDFYDKESDETYKGIYVTTYISRGANDTWEKVLDGTLTGFSIGGNIIDASSEFDKASEKTVRKINDYELYELSLVDNPANPLANIFSIEKGIDGLMLKGAITEISSENVFWCSNDEIAISSSGDSTSCPSCETNMKVIGWVENIEETKSLDIKNIVKNYTEGGTDMSDELTVESAEIEKNVVDEVEDIATEEVAEETVETLEKSDSADETVEETVEEVLEKSADSDTTDEFDIVKMLDDLRAAVIDKIDSGLEKATGAASESKQYVDEMLNTIKKSVDDMSEQHNTLSSKIDELNKRMDSYEAATAVKKSNDLEGSMEKQEIKKTSIWNGHFLSVQDL